MSRIVSNIVKLANKFEKKLVLAGVEHGAEDPQTPKAPQAPQAVLNLRKNFLKPLQTELIAVSGTKSPFNSSGISKFISLIGEASLNPDRIKSAQDSFSTSCNQLIQVTRNYFQWFNTVPNFSSIPASTHYERIGEIKKLIEEVNSTLRWLESSPSISEVPELKSYIPVFSQPLNLAMSGLENMEKFLGGAVPVQKEEKKNTYDPFGQQSHMTRQ